MNRQGGGLGVAVGCREEERGNGESVREKKRKPERTKIAQKL